MLPRTLYVKPSNVTVPLSYSCVPTGNRFKYDGSPATGGATQCAETCWTVDPWQVPKICHTSIVAPGGMGDVRGTIGPLPSPVLTALTKTLISEPGTKVVSTTCVSPACTGPTSGAGSRSEEHTS